MAKIIHFCAGLEQTSGMANVARALVNEMRAAGHDAILSCNPADICGKVDEVHLHGLWLPVFWCAGKCAKAVGAKLIVRPAGGLSPIARQFHGWKKRLVGFFVHRLLDRADVVQATCAAEADWIRAYHPRAQIEHIDLRRFFDLSKPVVWPKNKSAANPLHVLYLGRRHPLKGVQWLEQAVAGRAEVALRVVTNATGAALEEAWAWADVLCLPTLTENFGLVIAEALSRGKPVVTTDGAPAWSDLRPDQGIVLNG